MCSPPTLRLPRPRPDAGTGHRDEVSRSRLLCRNDNSGPRHSPFEEQTWRSCTGQPDGVPPVSPSTGPISPPADAPCDSLRDRLRDKERAENFPVALRLLPRAVRADLRAVYDVVRTIDDLG